MRRPSSSRLKRMGPAWVLPPAAVAAAVAGGGNSLSRASFSMAAPCINEARLALRSIDMEMAFVLQLQELYRKKG